MKELSAIIATSVHSFSGSNHHVHLYALIMAAVQRPTLPSPQHVPLRSRFGSWWCPSPYEPHNSPDHRSQPFLFSSLWIKQLSMVAALNLKGIDDNEYIQQWCFLSLTSWAFQPMLGTNHHQRSHSQPKIHAWWQLWWIVMEPMLAVDCGWRTVDGGL